MKPIDSTTYILLFILVTAWCALHSAMISVSVTEHLKKHFGPGFRFYRLFFNLTAIITLIPIVWFASSIRTPAIFQWNGYLRICQGLILFIAVLLFFLGARHYDALQFLGIRQIKQIHSNGGIAPAGKLDTSGVLGITRHPWYLASILLIWDRQLDVSVLLVNIILTSYLIVGTFLEERKLIREFGEAYLTYQRQVSMLMPYKWLKSKLAK